MEFSSSKKFHGTTSQIPWNILNKIRIVGSVELHGSSNIRWNFNEIPWNFIQNQSSLERFHARSSMKVAI